MSEGPIIEGKFRVVNSEKVKGPVIKIPVGSIEGSLNKGPAQRSPEEVKEVIQRLRDEIAVEEASGASGPTPIETGRQKREAKKTAEAISKAEKSLERGFGLADDADRVITGWDQELREKERAELKKGGKIKIVK